MVQFRKNYFHQLDLILLKKREFQASKFINNEDFHPRMVNYLIKAKQFQYFALLRLKLN